MKNLFKIYLPTFLLIFLFNSSHANLRIDITEGNTEPIPLALLNFSSNNKEDDKITKKIIKVVSNNLERSGLFEILDKKIFLEEKISFNSKPSFSDWRITKAQGLIHGRIIKINVDEIRIEFRLWDILSEKQMIAQQLTTKRTNWRRISHVISDIIYQRITGESGYFDSRIVYISESGEKKNKRKRLAIMDQDGANHKFLTDGSYLALTPRFSPAAQQIAYFSYHNGDPRVFLLDLDTGYQKILGDFPGMSFAPRFSPDGKKIIMSLAKKGNTDIYEMNLKTGKLEQITTYKGIDTAPSYSPDGKNIVFESDRSGSQQIYVLNMKTKKKKRISFGNGRYATPVWSPRGDTIAFTKLLGGEFYIGVMYTDGKGERVLYSSYLVEGPTWAPNGRVLSFYSQTKIKKNKITPPRIKIIDLTGSNLREIITPSDASDPAWSGLLP
ncbi:MAG: Tol-Pal system beta propeller repeat protein TolB [Rickettsiales bacterium]|nr:Tol-Pal system beta propeller repeat protein TolB [Rickettsiales bacterium]OUV52985.1 MAG: Tol-Pal system beta propeller repeat protein TolB [Rickettsiales bacterium TMED127]|tara:strand:- start:84742 stop:86064 length:1323 start_codon:yes stop_codon:yes gene_type:complete